MESIRLPDDKGEGYMIRLITGAVGSGKSTKLFKEVQESTKEHYRTLLLTSEYTGQYATQRMPEMDSNYLSIYGVPYGDMSVISSLILTGNYQKVFIDSGLHDIKDFKLLNAIAEYAELSELTITSQTNRNQSNEHEVAVLVYGE